MISRCTRGASILTPDVPLELPPVRMHSLCAALYAQRRRKGYINAYADTDCDLKRSLLGDAAMTSINEAVGNHWNAARLAQGSKSVQDAAGVTESRL